MAQKKSSGEINAYLDGETTLDGELNMPGSLRIDGRVKGVIRAGGEVVIGPTAEVDADITAAAVSISGKAGGSITVTERVEIFEGATVTSSLITPSLQIADGAVFQGHCEMKPGGRPAEGD